MDVEIVNIVKRVVYLTISNASLYTTLDVYGFEEGEDGAAVLPEGEPT